MNMKKIINIFLIAFALASTTSCGNDWLDLQSPTNIESEGSLGTLQQYEFVMNGIYSLMQSSDSFTGRFVYYGDVTADDIQAYSSTKRTGKYYLYDFVAGNAPSTFWRNPYEIISNCNIVVNGIDEIATSDNAGLEYKNDLKGQALAIRAMSLFYMNNFYGHTYTMDNGASLGVPIVLTTSGIDSKPSRNTVAECYDAIISDLKTAVSLLSPDFSKGKINRWGAELLLSRVYLYKADNVNALAMAENAIAGATNSGYRLWKNEEYAGAWAWDVSEDDPGEVLFEIVNLTTDSPGKESMGYLCSTAGYRDMILTSSFYSLLISDPKDARIGATTIYSKRAYIQKYMPQSGEADTDANITLLRLSEAYLNAAEAAVKLGDNTKAVAYLDPIVKRANPANSVEGTEITLDRVLTERRKEMFGEGHRLFDIMRNNLRVERVNVSVSKISSTKHLSQSSETLSFDRTYFKTVLPVPKAEIDANSNIPQNVGY